MSGLAAPLAHLRPRLADVQVVFVTLPGAAYGDHGDLSPVAARQEDEGRTLVVPRDRTDAAGLSTDGT